MLYRTIPSSPTMMFADRSSPGFRLPNGVRLVAVLAGLLWLVVSASLLVSDPALPAGPYTTVRRWVLAGSLVGFALCGLVLRRRQFRFLLGVSSVVSGLFAAAFALVPNDGGVIAQFLVFCLVGLMLYNIPIALILYGVGMRARAAEHPATAAEPRSTIERSPVAPSVADQAFPDLAADEERIGARLRHLAAQRQRVEAADALLTRELDAATRAPIRAKLNHAREILDQQAARHEARLWAIELVRWQFRLAPVAEDAARRAMLDPKVHLDALAALARDGETMLKRWVARKGAAATHEGARCVARIRMLLDGCADLRKRIAVQQAMLALRGIEPDEDERSTISVFTEPMDRLRVNLGSDAVTSALAELDQEHVRLQADQAEARDVERILRDLESGCA